MKKSSFVASLRSPKSILFLILLVFFLKGVFLETLTPIFGGQDEARHYNTIQFMNQPVDAVSIENKLESQDFTNRNRDDFETYNFSQEIQKTATATDTDVLRGELFNTISFSDSYDGLNESQINAGAWKPYNYYSNPDIASETSLYHRSASLIEKIFSSQSVLTRFYLIRTFSVLLGTLAIFFAYLIAKNIGFSSKHALILAAIISFQPKFSMYFTNINYDVLLIPMFFLFTLAGLLALKQGFNWKNIALLFVSITVATQTKATGYVLIIVLAGLVSYLIYEKVKSKNEKIKYGIFGACAFASLIVIVFFFKYFLKTKLSLGKTIASIIDYVSRTITFSKFVMPSETFWGNLSWTNSFVLNNVFINVIFIFEIAALIGLALFFFSKKFKALETDFLPEKKYVVFLIAMVSALELGIRVADWSIFNQIGGMQFSLGTPGRYFLPNLASHLILIFTGLGALLAHLKKEKYFNHVLLVGLIGMFSFSMYLIFNVIVYRFYL